MPRRLVTLALLAVATAGCSGPSVSSWPPREPGPLKDVWVVSHGWHTRVAVRRADVDPAVWPESRDLGAEVAYLEVGWGDRDFYPEPSPSIWDTIDPVIRPTPAALHVGGFREPPPAFLSDNPVVRLRVSPQGFQHLTRFIHEHYASGAAGRPVRIRPGYYQQSWFYLAEGRYHALFNNSNHWTARVLRAAGVPLTLATSAFASSVIRQAARLGEASEAGRPGQR